MPNENEQATDQDANETTESYEAETEQIAPQAPTRPQPVNDRTPDRVITAHCTCCTAKLSRRSPWNGVHELIAPVAVYLRISVRRQYVGAYRFAERLCEPCYAAMVDFLAERGATLALAALETDSADAIQQEPGTAVPGNVGDLVSLIS